MKVVFNITNKVFYTFIAIALVTCLAIVGYAYNSNFRGGNPPVMGHSSDEVNVKVPNSNDQKARIIGLQNAIDSESLNGECEFVGKIPNGRFSIPDKCRYGNNCTLHIVIDPPATPLFSDEEYSTIFRKVPYSVLKEIMPSHYYAVRYIYRGDNKWASIDYSLAGNLFSLNPTPVGTDGDGINSMIVLLTLDNKWYGISDDYNDRNTNEWVLAGPSATTTMKLWACN